MGNYGRMCLCLIIDISPFFIGTEQLNIPYSQFCLNNCLQFGFIHTCYARQSYDIRFGKFPICYKILSMQQDRSTK